MSKVVKAIAFCGLILFGQISLAKETNKELANQVKDLFARSCFGCHGAPGTPAKAGLDVLDYDQLINDGLVIPGASTFSTLYDYIQSGQMPPFGENFPDGTTPQFLNEKEVETVAKWIDGGAESWDVNENENELVDYESVLKIIDQDLKKKVGLEAGRTRYISLVHLKNQGLSEEELQYYRLALIKFLNSLSGATELYIPETIDKDRLIYSLDINFLGWFPNTWRRMERDYPFGVDELSQLEKNLTRKMVTRNAFLRGDWIVGVASRPPLYHEILFVDALGLSGSDKNSLEELEESLGVDRVDNILSGKAVRGGFNSSGVSVNNRIIERHATTFYEGAYWLSYDFAGNSADPQKRENIFAFPLGPIEAFPEAEDTFLHAGGEVIFSLPNGLHGYLLTDQFGTRIDKAPTDIVTDPARPDNAVENGASCFRCHDKGIILKRDSIREFINLNQELYADNFVVLKETYQGNDLFYDLQKKDLNRYLQVVNRLGVSVKKQEPVSRILVEFEKDMDFTAIASELYQEEEALFKLVDKNQSLKSIIGPAAVSGERIKRDYFIENFKTLYKEIY